jgi:hypothetical protein
MKCRITSKIHLGTCLYFNKLTILLFHHLPGSRSFSSPFLYIPISYNSQNGWLASYSRAPIPSLQPSLVLQSGCSKHAQTGDEEFGGGRPRRSRPSSPQQANALPCCVPSSSESFCCPLLINWKKKKSKRKYHHPLKVYSIKPLAKAWVEAFIWKF